MWQQQLLQGYGAQNQIKTPFLALTAPEGVLKDLPVAWVVCMNTIPWGSSPWSSTGPKQEEEEQGCAAEGSALELPDKARQVGLGLVNITGSEAQLLIIAVILFQSIQHCRESCLW